MSGGDIYEICENNLIQYKVYNIYRIWLNATPLIVVALE